MHYTVQATVTHTMNDGRIVKQIPTFCLNKQIQGIVDLNHAVVIAYDILMPFPHLENITVSFCIVDEQGNAKMEKDVVWCVGCDFYGIIYQGPNYHDANKTFESLARDSRNNPGSPYYRQRVVFYRANDAKTIRIHQGR
jgi:hypothetical protein